MSKVSSSVQTASKSNGWGIAIAVLVVVVLIFVAFGLWGTYTDSGKSTFANIKSRFANLPGIGGGTDLRSLDVVMFMSPTCPWCKKMMDVLNEQLKNLTIVDVTKPEGVAIAQQFGADKQPVPSFISRKNKTGTVGYRDSVAKLIDALKQGAPSQPVPGPQLQPGGSSEEPGGVISNSPNLIEFIKSLQIIAFTREGCGHCTRFKNDLGQSGVADVIQVVDIMTPEGQSMAGQLLPPGTSGVPAFVSMATKKNVVGYKSFDQLIQSLQNGNVPNMMA